ncbi:hypothetical protein GCM10010399_49070 [Dactylosporangium fulvum]|uniref:Uncharacterized protein n=1 Tax=Dactylosporangium fulvum TaxID=53359 RepID=A0ABY5VXC1_9ACTN|nr:hypothetical protein [Dactylosporangium fulvum]UWP81912.1 hypothetical protein Dfulv_43660 [Dactylosporangium fulvum]
MPDEDQLGAAVRKLVGQVAHWTPSRWAASSMSGPARSDLVHDVIQWLADRSAEAEGRPAVQVPRLDNDLALPDQLRVIAADLSRFGSPDDVAQAADRVNSLRHALS